MRAGLPVVRTRSKTARLAALNFEIAMDSMNRNLVQSTNLSFIRQLLAIPSN